MSERSCHPQSPPRSPFCLCACCSYSGVVSSSVYATFARALGPPWLLCIFFMLCTAVEVSKTSSLVWLTHWSDDKNADAHATTYIGVYLGLMLLTAVLSLARNFGILFAGYKAAWYVMQRQRSGPSSASISLALCCCSNLHAKMLSAVLKTSVAWFNATPQGQVRLVVCLLRRRALRLLMPAAVASLPDSEPLLKRRRRPRLGHPRRAE